MSDGDPRDGTASARVAAQESDEGVALESCEFWSAFCEASVEPEVLRPYLPRLVPALMRNMMYGEFDEEVRPRGVGLGPPRPAALVAQGLGHCSPPSHAGTQRRVRPAEAAQQRRAGEPVPLQDWWGAAPRAGGEVARIG